MGTEEGEIFYFPEFKSSLDRASILRNPRVDIIEPLRILEHLKSYTCWPGYRFVTEKEVDRIWCPTSLQTVSLP